jgi:Mrp family chromosome partitioning ATPase
VRDIRVLAISSPGLGDGKTVTAINLAAAHAESERVLLIDADLRRPSIDSQLRLTDVSGPGLADALSDDRFELASLVRQVGRHSIRRDPGRRSIGPSSRTASIASTRSPPAGSSSSVSISSSSTLRRCSPSPTRSYWRGRSTALSLSSQPTNTPRKLLEESLNLLEPSKVLGIVFNKDHRPLYGYYNGGLP